MENQRFNFEMIVTIVEKGYASDVIDAAHKGGAEGATVLNGRGSGVHEKAKFFGVTIEPEKEVVLVMVPSDIRNQVLKSIAKGIDINKPGHGVSFVIDLAKVVGISHLQVLADDYDDDDQTK